MYQRIIGIPRNGNVTNRSVYADLRVLDLCNINREKNKTKNKTTTKNAYLHNRSAAI